MYRALMGRIRSSSPVRRSVNMINTPRPLSVRPIARKTVLPLRVGRVRKNGQRTRKKAFDSGDGEPMFLVLYCCNLIYREKSLKNRRQINPNLLIYKYFTSKSLFFKDLRESTAKSFVFKDQRRGVSTA